MSTIAFNYGEFQNLNDIQIPITSLSINRGYGAFEFFEVINRKPFYGNRHFLRLKNTMKLLKLITDFDNDLESVVKRVIDFQSQSNFYIKIFVLPHQLSTGDSYNAGLYILPAQMSPFNEAIYTQGGKLLLKQYGRFLPEAKSTNYLSGQYWSFELEEKQAVDVLYHNGKTVQESARGNIFIVKNNQIITPGINILKGVTRSVVLDILDNENINFVEREISIDELLGADEVFLSSTTKLVMPIVQIDDKIIGNGIPGKHSTQLLDRFIAIKAGYRNLINT